MPTLSRVFLGVLAVSASVVAQRTWIVDQAGGPGTDFRDIPAAVNFANDGDVILCRAGNYTGTTTSKGLTLLGEPGATLNALIRRAMTVIALPAGKTFAMKGFSADFTGLPGVSPLRVSNSLGRVHLEDLHFVADYYALDLAGGAITMSQVRAAGSTALAVNSISNGLGATIYGLSASRCDFSATTGAAVLLPIGQSSAGSFVDFSQCTATSVGGAALSAVIGGPFYGTLSLLGDSSSSYTSAPGYAVISLTMAPGNLFIDPAVRLLGSPQSVIQPIVRRMPALEGSGAAPGQSITSSLYSPVGDLVVLVLSFPDYPFPVPPFGTMWIDPTLMFHFAVGTQDATEHWQQQVAVPNFAPRGLAIGLQGMSGPGFDIHFGNAVVVLLH